MLQRGRFGPSISLVREGYVVGEVTRDGGAAEAVIRRILAAANCKPETLAHPLPRGGRLTKAPNDTAPASRRLAGAAIVTTTSAQTVSRNVAPSRSPSQSKPRHQD